MKKEEANAVRSTWPCAPLACGAVLVVLAILNAQLSTCLAQGTFPPATGPTVPIMKTLQQIEPRTDVLRLSGDFNSHYLIAYPGSYYLTTNIYGEGAKHCIKITANDVTLDLNGFLILGMSSSLAGVLINSPTGGAVTNVVVQNGTIEGNTQHGVGAVVHGGRFERVLLANNGQCGLLASGDNCAVSDCQAVNNSLYGFWVGSQCTVRNCSAISNRWDGFRVERDCTLISCKSTANIYNGFNLYYGGDLLLSCTATENGDHGFYLYDNCTMQSCVAISNEDWGIQAGYDSCVIKDCSVKANRAGGIRLGSRCLAQNNVCNANTGVGIDVTGKFNRIDSNQAMDNTLYTIQVLANNDNLIVRNMGNRPTGEGTSYNIPAGNTYGKIVLLYVGEITSTTGWENFDHWVVGK